MVKALLNGLLTVDKSRALSVEERGLAYGDGLFETMRLENGNVRFLNAHLSRLKSGCERLGIPQPRDELLGAELAQLLEGATKGVVKLIITRGAQGRGYRADPSLQPTRLLLLYPWIESPSDAIRLRWCATRYGRNPQLAGMKHLNRLEQVLGQNEWNDPDIAEGLMLDIEGEVVSATASNLFLICDGELVTPDLRFCGVRGVMRQQVLIAASKLGLHASERAVWPEDVLGAEEIFLTNAVKGIRAVCALEDKIWNCGTLTQRLINAVAELTE